MKKSIRTSLVNRLPFQLRRSLFKLKLYLKAPKLLFLSQKTFATNSPPTVMLSFPRSGSSWIGSILGMGEDVRYLREPATTNYTLTKNKNNNNNKTKPATQTKRISVFDQDSCDNWVEYRQYIDDSLAAKPNFPNTVIAYPKQWQSPKQKKSLFIKEVNPLVINYYLTKQVKLIYLVRHPFSVAKSYQALNWRSNDLFTKKFNSETLAVIKIFMPNIQEESIWLQMGYLQGLIEASVKEKIATTNNSVSIIRYEDICQAPDEQFKQLFSFANIDYSTNIIKKIKSTLSRKDIVTLGDFSSTRNSAMQAQVIIPPEEHKAYSQLMNAYQQAFSDFKQSKKISDSSTKSTTVSYQKESSIVTLR